MSKYETIVFYTNGTISENVISVSKSSLIDGFYCIETEHNQKHMPIDKIRLIKYEK